MKTLFVAPFCSFLLLSFAGCGGDQPASGPGGTGAAAKQSEDTPTAGTPTAGTPSVGTQEPTKTVEAPKPQAPKKPTPRPRINPDSVRIFFGNETSYPELDTPATADQVALGKALYFEKHLSKDGNISCATCHDLSNFGVDGKPTSPGADGKSTARNTPSTYNAFRQFRQMWDGRVETVEQQATIPVLEASFHGLADAAQLVVKINEKPELVAGFKKAFPDDAEAVTAVNFGRAIGAFERTLVTRSRWDDYLDGNQKALSNDELFGLQTFMDLGCRTCHLNRTLGGQIYQKTGLLKSYSSTDTGRMQITKSEADKSFFKVPMLINVAKTAPYFHDGKVATLEEAVARMADLQLEKQLTPEQTAAIVAFLNATTGVLPAEFAQAK